MKKFLLILTLLLSGCATTQVVTPNIIEAPYEIMSNCSEYVYPEIGNFTYNDLLDVIVKNKKVYVNCVKLNNAKKDFILRQQEKIITN